MDAGRWDPLEWLEADASACVMNYLSSPTDVACAAAVSRSWRNFGTQSYFF
jgi:hypothetical protein